MELEYVIIYDKTLVEIIQQAGFFCELDTRPRFSLPGSVKPDSYKNSWYQTNIHLKHQESIKLGEIELIRTGTQIWRKSAYDQEAQEAHDAYLASVKEEE